MDLIDIFKTVFSIGDASLNLIEIGKILQHDIKSFREANLRKQLLNLFKEMENNNCDEKTKNKIISKLTNDIKTQEVVFQLLVILENNINTEKTKIYAHILMGFIKGDMDYYKFNELIEITSRIFLVDLNILERQLESFDYENLTIKKRLEILGLMEHDYAEEYNKNTGTLKIIKNKYVITDLGKEYLKYI